MKELFKTNKIGYYELNSIIEKYVSDYPKYIRSSRTINRIIPIKTINIEGPNLRYEYDLTYLNNHLANFICVKIILSVIYAFSRKAMIYKGEL